MESVDPNSEPPFRSWLAYWPIMLFALAIIVFVIVVVFQGAPSVTPVTAT